MIALKRVSTGFTLLELLIALTLLGMILVILFGGLRMASRVWDASELHTRNATHLGSLQGFLRRQLTQVRAYRWPQDKKQELAFSGARESLRMVTPIVAHHDPGGLYLVGLEWVETRDSGQLLMSRVVPNKDSNDFSELNSVEKIVLAEQVKRLKFAYFGADTITSEPLWRDRWEDMQGLPFLIRMRITFSDGRDWPDLVVAPKLGGDAGCLWDAAVNQCVDG